MNYRVNLDNVEEDGALTLFSLTVMPEFCIGIEDAKQEIQQSLADIMGESATAYVGPALSGDEYTDDAFDVIVVVRSA